MKFLGRAAGSLRQHGRRAATLQSCPTALWAGGAGIWGTTTTNSGRRRGRPIFRLRQGQPTARPMPDAKGDGGDSRDPRRRVRTAHRCASAPTKGPPGFGKGGRSQGRFGNLRATSRAIKQIRILRRMAVSPQPPTRKSRSRPSVRLTAQSNGPIFRSSPSTRRHVRVRNFGI